EEAIELVTDAHVAEAAVLPRWPSTQSLSVGAGCAPIIRATSLPWSRRTRVGIPRMPNRWETVGAVSMLIVTSLRQPGRTCSIRSIRRSSFDAVLGGDLYRCSPKNPTRLELTKPRHGPCLIENRPHPREECA